MFIVSQFALVIGGASNQTLFRLIDRYPSLVSDEHISALWFNSLSSHRPTVALVWILWSQELLTIRHITGDFDIGLAIYRVLATCPSVRLSQIGTMSRLYE